MKKRLATVSYHGAGGVVRMIIASIKEGKCLVDSKKFMLDNFSDNEELTDSVMAYIEEFKVSRFENVMKLNEMLFAQDIN